MTGLAWSQMTVMDHALTVEGEGVLFKMDTRRAVHHTLGRFSLLGRF